MDDGGGGGGGEVIFLSEALSRNNLMPSEVKK